MDGSLNILWGRGEGSSPGIARKSTLLWWMRVDRGPFLSDQVKIVILRGCKWTGEIIDIFSGLLVGLLLGRPFVLVVQYIGISKPVRGRGGFPVSCG